MTINEYIGIHQFFTRQNFPNPDSSKFSTVKILHHTVYTTHTYISTYKHMYTHAHTDAHTRAHTHTQMHAYTDRHTHTDTQTHTQHVRIMIAWDTSLQKLYSTMSPWQQYLRKAVKHN